MRLQAGLAVSMVALCFVAAADVIRVDGEVFEDVVVREGANRYYVQFPSDGSMRSFSKSDVDASTVVKSEAREREALKAQWHAVRTPEAPETSAREARPDVPAEEEVEGITREGGAIKVTLRGENGDRQRMAFRAYQINNAMATMPKIVVSNPGGSSERDAVSFSNISELFGGSGGVTGFGGGYGGGYGGGGQGGYGGGQGGFGGGQGGFGGGQGGFGGGQGGFGGGQGGFGGGQGGFGGGQGGFGGGGGQQGGAFFRNIAELFGTINDLQVGETPAIIGLTFGGMRY